MLHCFAHLIGQMNINSLIAENDNLNKDSHTEEDL